MIISGCLTNALAPPPIAQEICSRAQTDRQSSCLHSKKFFGVGLRFFVSDVISEVVFGPFGSCFQA